MSLAPGAEATRLLTEHASCLDRQCRWPDVRCSGGTELPSVPHFVTREEIKRERYRVQFANNRGLQFGPSMFSRKKDVR